MDNVVAMPVKDAAVRFAEDAVAGSFPIAASAKLACQRFLDDLERTDWPWRYDVARADRFIGFCQQLTLSGGQWEGKPWNLKPWHEFV